jgi:hypothetical protein
LEAQRKQHEKELALKKEQELARQKAEEEAKKHEEAARLEEERKARELEAQKVEEERRYQAEKEQLEREAQQQQIEQQEVVPPVVKERHEIVTRKDHKSELNEGHYVIVGAFSIETGAKTYSDQLKRAGFSQTNYGYLTNKGYWYVHVFVSDDINATRAERDEYRKMPRFNDAWLLTIEQ